MGMLIIGIGMLIILIFQLQNLLSISTSIGLSLCLLIENHLFLNQDQKWRVYYLLIKK